MKRLVVVILIIIFICPMVLFSQNKVIKSNNLLAYEEANIKTEILTDDYLSQLGLVIQEKELVDPLALVNIAVSDINYPITVGDVYTLTYYESLEVITIPLQVMFSNLVVPTIGSFELDGKTFVELKDEIEKAILNRNAYAYPNLTISSIGLFDVNVKGEVVSNTKVKSNSLAYLSDFAVYASNNASTREVVVVDKNNNSKTYDLYAALKADGVNPRINLGDTIIFKSSKNKVSISGAVNQIGTYQLDNMSLDNLIDNYAKGISNSAACDEIVVTRYSSSNAEEFVVKYGSDFMLENGDNIYVPKLDMLKGTVVIEGSLLSSIDPDKAGTLGDQKYFYQFKDGDTLYDLVVDLSNYYDASTDLVNTYLTREGSSSVVSFQDVLSGKLDKELLDGDVYTLPYSKSTVNVIGAVNESGIYSIIPGKTASYYINLAQGYSSLAKGVGLYTITDKDGNELDKDSIICGESTIQVEVDKVGPSLTRTSQILSITTASLAVITATLSILTTTGVI